jgi:hypothetical protein
MTRLTAARVTTLCEWRACGRDTQKKLVYSSWAYQTGEAQGFPALSAVARVRYWLASMICWAALAGSGSLAG